MEKVYIIEENWAQTRLDVFLEKQAPEFTRSHYKNQIDRGEVFVNGKNVKAGTKLKTGDEVKLLVAKAQKLNLEAKDLALEIVYEDADLAVINKPQGLVVHPAVGNWDNTLVHGLLYSLDNLSGINGIARPGIVHRLDKDTSGLIIVAKNDAAHVGLGQQIQDKTCKRYYLALLVGTPKQNEGIIQNYLARDPKNRLKFAVFEGGAGKEAVTHYKVLERFSGYSLVEFELKTGRTHQIRVHAAHLGHAVVGDKLYNTQPDRFGLAGQLLHAYRLEFLQPTSKTKITLLSELPPHFQRVLEKLRNG